MLDKKLTFWIRSWKRFDLQQDVEGVQGRLATTHQGGHLGLRSRSSRFKDTIIWSKVFRQEMRKGTIGHFHLKIP